MSTSTSSVVYQSGPRHHRLVMQICVILALLAALAYALTAVGVLSTGLDTTEAPAAIPWFACMCYVIGGLLVLLRSRRLWMTGLVINAIVISIFVTAYLQRPEVMFSPAGIATKSAQFLLELGLLYLFVTTRRVPS